MATRGSTLLAVVRTTGVVELGVRDGSRIPLVTLGPDTVVDTPALTPTGELRLTTRAGWLLGYAGSHETFRHSTTPPSALPVFTYPDALLPPLIDPSGAVAFVTSSATVGIAAPNGEIRTAVLSECGAPGALVPLGERQLAALCRSGFIALISDAARTTERTSPPPPPARPRFP